VYEKSLEMSTSLFLRTRRRQSWPFVGSLESLVMENMRQRLQMEAVGCIIDAGQDGKTEILAQTSRMS
jgi:hypothetical protein